jgi:DNA-binding Lrp family transcriptional regulator
MCFKPFFLCLKANVCLGGFMPLDQKDKNILNVLSNKSRLSYREIAKQVGISVATALHRVKRLEQEGIIRGYTIGLDYDKLGYDVGVIIHVRVSKGMLMEVERKIASDPHVVALYDTTGTYDAVVIAHFKSRRSLDSFLKKIQGFDFVERTETVLILNEIKSRNVEIG